MSSRHHVVPSASHRVITPSRHHVTVTKSSRQHVNPSPRHTVIPSSRHHVITSSHQHVLPSSCHWHQVSSQHVQFVDTTHKVQRSRELGVTCTFSCRFSLCWTAITLFGVVSREASILVCCLDFPHPPSPIACWRWRGDGAVYSPIPHNTLSQYKPVQCIQCICSGTVYLGSSFV